MPDYKNAKIYKIWSPEGDDIYIGATTQPLFKRLHHHKSAKDCSSKILFEKYTDVRIELVECYPCNSKEEITKKEGEFIRTLDCVNRNVAGRTTKEYYKENKEYYEEWRKEHYDKNKEQLLENAKKYRDNNKERKKEWSKEYRENNKEHLKEYFKAYRSQPYTCECGRTMLFTHRARHLKSKIHKKLMQQVVEPHQQVVEPH